MIVERDSLDDPGPEQQPLTGEHLTGSRLAAQPRGQVQRRSPIALLDRDGCAGVQADPHAQGKLGVECDLIGEHELEVHGRSQRLRCGLEHSQRFVSSEFDHVATARLDAFARDLSEGGRQPCGRLVSSRLRERCVPTDVRDQEGQDAARRFHAHVGVFLSRRTDSATALSPRLEQDYTLVGVWATTRSSCAGAGVRQADQRDLSA